MIGRFALSYVLLEILLLLPFFCIVFYQLFLHFFLTIFSVFVDTMFVCITGIIIQTSYQQDGAV